MTKTLIIENGQKSKEEQFKESRRGKKISINFDEDREELSSAMINAFKGVVVQ